MKRSPTSPSSGGPDLRTIDPARVGDLSAGLESRAIARGWTWQCGLPISCIESAFDTDDRHLERAGVSLIVHEEETLAELRMQPLAGRKAGVTRLSPIERTPELRSSLSSDSLPGRLGEQIRTVIGSRALNCRQTRRFRRTPFRALEGSDVIEAGEIVESMDGAPIGSLATSPIVVRIDRSTADLECWLIAAGVLTPERSDSPFPDALAELEFGQALFGDGPVAVHAEMSASEAAFAVLRRQCVKIVANEPVARLGEDPEGLHSLRVALRRARAALRLFEPFVPGAFGLDRALGWVASRLGPVRDLDVQLAALPSWSEALRAEERAALTPIEALLRGRQEFERKRMLGALNSNRWTNLVQRLTRLLRQGPSKHRAATRTTVLAAAPGLIADSFRRVVEQARKARERATPARLHKLRIRCKSLRYALEFHEPLFARSSRAILTLTELQDLLGAHQDAVVAERRLRQMAIGSGPRLPRESIFVCGRLAQGCRRRARRIRRRAPVAIERFIDREHRRLARLLLEAAPTAGSIKSSGQP